MLPVDCSGSICVLPLGSPGAAGFGPCHLPQERAMKQTMVDSSCRVLTSDVFRGECNRLVRACKLGGQALLTMDASRSFRNDL